jgi:hypothetical protein
MRCMAGPMWIIAASPSFVRSLARASCAFDIYVGQRPTAVPIRHWCSCENTPERPTIASPISPTPSSHTASGSVANARNVCAVSSGSQDSRDTGRRSLQVGRSKFETRIARHIRGARFGRAVRQILPNGGVEIGVPSDTKATPKGEAYGRGKSTGPRSVGLDLVTRANLQPRWLG